MIYVEVQVTYFAFISTPLTTEVVLCYSKNDLSANTLFSSLSLIHHHVFCFYFILFSFPEKLLYNCLMVLACYQISSALELIDCMVNICLVARVPTKSMFVCC